MTEKIKAHVLMYFFDAGTGKAYDAGSCHNFEAASHANYIVAGLIGEVPNTAKSNSANAPKAKA